MKNVKWLIAGCLLGVSACLFACSPQVAMKPDTPMASEVVLSIAPTPMETPIPATPMPTMGPKSITPQVRHKRRPAYVNAETMANTFQPAQSKFPNEKPTETITAAQEQVRTQDEQPWLNWTPTPIAQAAPSSRAGAETSTANQHGSWVLVGAALLIAIVAVLLTYRRSRMLLRNGAEENLFRTTQRQRGPEPSAQIRKAETPPTLTAEPETKDILKPESAGLPAAAEVAPEATTRKPVRRIRKPPAKSRVVKSGSKASVAKRLTKAETRKRAA